MSEHGFDAEEVEMWKALNAADTAVQNAFISLMSTFAFEEQCKPYWKVVLNICTGVAKKQKEEYSRGHDDGMDS